MPLLEIRNLTVEFSTTSGAFLTNDSSGTENLYRAVQCVADGGS